MVTVMFQQDQVVLSRRMSMSDQQVVDRRVSNHTMERHASSIGIALIIAMLLWVGNSILTQSKTQGKISGDIRVMASEVKHLKQIIKDATENRYTALDAKRDRDECERRYSGIVIRIDELEERYHGSGQ